MEEQSSQSNLSMDLEIYSQVRGKGKGGLGHYYRSCPRNRTQAHEKRLLEKDLLHKLEPKEKEHQRKKLLRIFFTWRSKQVALPYEQKFWNWVRKLNPDNVKSEERFKSMSYEFLDKLMGKKVFRDTFLVWMESYEPELGDSDEEQKSRIFLNFIRNVMRVKETIQNKIRSYLDTYPMDMSFGEVQESKFKRTSQSQPVKPGFYFESKCRNSKCAIYRSKDYVYVGINQTFDYTTEASVCVCRECLEPLVIINIGFLDCKWVFRGETHEGCSMQGQVEMSHGYSNFDEVKFESWKWLQIKTAVLSEQEKQFSEFCVFSSFEDPSIPKKKYKKRKKPSSEQPEVFYQLVQTEQTYSEMSSEHLTKCKIRLCELDREIEYLLEQERTTTQKLLQLKKNLVPAL